jgi:hypothetical protein
MARATAQSSDTVQRANQRAIEAISQARIRWVDVVPAAEALPVLRSRTLLHAGPPLPAATMCGAMRNAVEGALVYERWAADLSTARELVEAGEIGFASAHDHCALGPMAGIISPSMPLLVLEDEASGNRSYVTINEGLGRTLRFGANDERVIQRLRWIERSLAALLRDTVRLSGPVNISEIMGRALQRGDECHNRNKAATSLLFRKVAPWMLRTDFSKEQIAEALFFMDGNDHFFLNFSMAATKATMEAVHQIEGGSLVSCMAANGVQFGIRVTGCGSRWYTAPAPKADGQYFGGFSAADASPVMGDSYISETAGLGGVAMAAAPGIVRFVGGSVQEALQGTLQMYRITVAEHPLYKIPSLGFRGTPLGIDVRAVLRTGILPIINTGIAHRDPGVGQIGAGRFRPPWACFEAAAAELGLG